MFVSNNSLMEELDYHKMPDLLNFKFQSIYKNDGLQFDERWQERMLERYLMMKLQREQRQIACANRRALLIYERRYKSFSHNMDIMYGDSCEESKWSRMKGEPPTARPPSVAGSYGASSKHEFQGLHETENGQSNKYRFSIRHSPSDQTSNSGEFAKRGDLFSTTVPSATQLKMPTFHQTAGTKPTQKLLVRPRSSTSIPGKTRYVLVKEDKAYSKSRSLTPSKMEEELLRKRFPGQYHAVMRSMYKCSNDESIARNGITETLPQSNQSCQTIRRSFTKPHTLSISSSLLLSRHTTRGNNSAS